MITLAFFCFSSVSVFCVVFDAKSTLSDAFFWCLFIRYGAIFWCFANSPVLLDGGHHREVVRFVKMLRYPLVSCRYPVFSVNACIYSTLRPFLCQHLEGFAPNPNLTCGAAGQAVKTQPPDPVAKCWVGSKASRVKCTASPPLTPLHLRESSKTIEADGLETCQGLRSNRLRPGLYRLEATQRSVVRVQEVFPCTPARGEREGVGSAHGVGKTLGGRAVGDSVP